MTPLTTPSIAITMNRATMPALRATLTTTWANGKGPQVEYSTTLSGGRHLTGFTVTHSTFILERISGPIGPRDEAIEVLMSSKIIGIDLGTTNSVVAVME